MRQSSPLEPRSDSAKIASSLCMWCTQCKPILVPRNDGQVSVSVYYVGAINIIFTSLREARQFIDCVQELCSDEAILVVRNGAPK